MPEAKLPTEDEIAQLPRWARVAFAARCARRAQPLFVKHWPEAAPEHLQAVRWAIRTAEGAAADACGVPHTETEGAFAAGDAAYHDAPEAAFAAARTAHAAVDVAYTSTTTHSVAADAAVSRTERAVSYATRAGVSIDQIAADFATVRDAALHGGWDDNTPVPPSVFDLPAVDEPTGLAPGSKELTLGPPKQQLRLKVYRTAAVSDELVGEKIVELYDKLNEYCLAAYGTYLTEKQFEQFVNTGVLAPSPAGGS